ncbi:MAG: DinB family protein [Roseovarius sp.]
MILPDYARVMARYNGWQNRLLAEALEGVPLAELTADRGAAFGSILGTLNHLLWADALWMSRLDPAFAPPAGGLADSAGLCPTLGVWEAERFVLDGRIAGWAAQLSAVRLAGEVRWPGAAGGEEMRRPVALVVMHMFNQQAHHRAQVHAMMTAAGLAAPVSDLCGMPGP